MEGLAIVYEACNFQGSSGVIHVPGSYNIRDLPRIGVRDDAISALKVASGYELVLYEHPNFLGRNVTLVGDISCLLSMEGGLNDQTSSLILRRTRGAANISSKSKVAQPGHLLNW